MPSRCNPVPYCRIHCRTLLSCTVLPNAVKLHRTAESVLCYAGKLCRGKSYVPRLCETRLRQKRNKNEKSTRVRKSDPINSESHTRHSRNHPCPTPSSRKNIGPSPHRLDTPLTVSGKALGCGLLFRIFLVRTCLRVRVPVVLLRRRVSRLGLSGSCRLALPQH